MEVVSVARKPDVFVRAVTPEEGRKLQQVARRSKQPVRARRAIVVMASAQHQSVPLIAKLMQVSESYVRQVIHDFNEKGFDALDPKWSGGRPAKTDQVTRDRICQIARCCPRDLGWPFSVWSLSKLVEVLRINGIADISRETLRAILHAGAVSWQATKTWKASNDPEFVEKMTRVLDLYDHPPADGRVVCVDEFGPLNLQPRPGRGWFPQRRPARLRATYHRTQGVRHMFGALDLATGRLYYRIRDRKRWTEFLAFLKSLRTRWPQGKLYLILDNYSVHKRREVREWCADNAVELVFLPTSSSWLNRIECEFAALRYFALNGTDHRSHDEQDDAIADYIRWRNQHAGPVRDFAVGSKIRHPDYLPNVA
ncbi:MULTISPECIES: IS630 family transposase [Nocardia]|uniref:IS630 family transposase n=1 Tax=Nocardia TaxID=1817 RepID=UPI001D156348|nr:IS630 family transposase [Nocardia africana]MCC3317865.1 IS630 family transposase [Nocardia africana]